MYVKPALWGGNKQNAIANLKKACDLAEISANE
jgi:hypothetical protein